MSGRQLLAIGAGSYVGVFEATKEQASPENVPLDSLHGRFCKPRCSQVFTCGPGSLRYRQTLPYLSFLPCLPTLPYPPALCHFSFSTISVISATSAISPFLSFLSYMSILSFPLFCHLSFSSFPLFDQPCTSLMVHHEFCRLSLKNPPHRGIPGAGVNPSRKTSATPACLASA